MPTRGVKHLLYLLACLSLVSLSFSVQAQTACSTTPGTLLQWNFNSENVQCNGATPKLGIAFGYNKATNTTPLFEQNKFFYCPQINSGCGQALLGSTGHHNSDYFANGLCLRNFYDSNVDGNCTYDPNSTTFNPEQCANFYITYTVPAGKASCVTGFKLDYMQKQNGSSPVFQKQGFAVKRNGVLIYSTTQNISSANQTFTFPTSGSQFCTDGNAAVTYTLIFGLVRRLVGGVQVGYDNLTVLGTCGSPNATASAKAATCNGGSPASNGSITLTNFGTGNRFAFTTGSTYTGSATFGSATAIPANGIIASNLAGVASPQTYTVRIFSASCYIDRTLTLNPTICAPVCTQPAGSVAAVQATCSGATANSNAQVRVSGVTNGDRVGLVAGGSGASLTYGSASALSGGAFTFTGLANPGSAQTYTVRIFNGSGSCFTDRTLTLNPANCVAACTQPSGTVTDVSATCSGTVASNNAQVTVTGVSNGDRAAIVAGGSGASLTYAGASNLSGGAFTFTGLANPATSQLYTVRIFNGSNTCFVDRTVTINAAVCPGPPVCTNPSGTATAVAATCSGSTANSNGQIIVSGVTGGDRVAIAAGGPSSALTYASSSALSGGGFTLSGLANPAVTAQRYTVRIFNGNNTCYTDLSVDLPAAPCTTCQPMCAEVIASDAADPNSEPDNGLGTEDDYACADVCTGNQRIHLVLNKTVSPATVTVGGNITFSLTLQNTGTLSASAIQVADDLLNPYSTSFTVVSGTPSSGTYTNAQGWEIDNLAAGATATLSIVAKTLMPGSYTNCAEIVGVYPPGSDTNPTQYTSCVPFTVTGPPPPRIEKDFSPQIVRPNVPFRLTLKLYNDNATPITLTAPFTDNLPAQMTVAATPNISTNPSFAGVVATAGGSTITIPSGTTLLPGLTQIYVDVTVPASGTYCNTIAVGSLQTSVGPNLLPAQECVEAGPFVLAPMLSKTFGPNGLATGQVGSLTITVENRNAFALTTIQDFYDYLPRGLVLAAGSNTGTCPNIAGFAAGDTIVTMNTGAVLAANATCTIIVPVTSSVAGLYCNLIPQNALLTTGGGVAMLGNEDIAQACLTVTNTPCVAVTGATLTRTPSGAVTPGSIYTLTTTATGTSPLTTFAYSANGGILFANAGANPTSFTAPVTAGVYTVTVVVNNNATGSGSCTATATTSFTIAGPTAGLGDYVFLDANKDGIQNTGDTPIPGVTVTLFINGVASATTVTNAGGLYSFTGLTPGSSNSYSVGFTQPTGLTATLQQAGGNDALDSDADVITGRTRSVTLANGEFNPNLDAGFYPIPASLGDYVFRDNNLNGIQDAGDVPIPGVTATLYINGVVSATTVTNGSGLYSFTGLTPGNSLSYSVGFSTPTGLTATLANQGGNDALDSDADLITGRTQSVTLAPGENNPTLDAGFYAPVFDLALRKTLAGGQAANVVPGSNVTFTITVFNQGNVTATNIQVSDYIPAGLTLNDANWTASGGIATLVAPIASLSAGSSTTRDIVFTVSNAISVSTAIVNVAEISSATGGTDVDSSPDNNPGNDSGGTPNSPADDTITGSGTGTVGGTSAAGDEDDADPAVITVTPLPVCSINPVVTVGPCLTATNTYSTTAVVTLANTGAGGTLTVSTQGQSLTTAVGAGLSSFTYTATFNGLLSNGISQSVTASLPGCGSATATYTAPASCSVAPACAVLTPVVTAGVCN
ncbi:SdrD B-like domain-containing protein [Spirosoma areae]